jgi:hypothetical protein
MSMDSRDWQDFASVYRAGAERAAGWSHNTAMVQHTAVLERQADRCEEIAPDRDGNPPVVHDHDHFHTDPDDPQHRLRHHDRHSHGRGQTEHTGGVSGHAHDGGRDGGLDPFALLQPLFPPERSGS